MINTGRDDRRFAAAAAIALIVLFVVLFAALAGFLFWRSYDDARGRAELQAVSAAHVVSANAKWVIETARQTLRRIDQTVGDDLANLPPDASGDLGQEVDSLPIAVKTYVVDARGVTRFTTDPEFKPINITDRQYFSALANGARWYISPLIVSRLNGEQIFVVSHRLERGGTFIGAAIVSIPASLFEDFWSSLNLGPDSTISVINTDGQVVVRYPKPAGPVDVSTSVLFTDYLPEGPEGTYEATSALDGVSRIVGYRRVEGEDLVAVASVGKTTAFNQFWITTRTTLTLALPAALALLFVSMWVVALIRTDSRRRGELARALERNQVLFREIHHRVKNNLQSVSSLIRLQPLPQAAKDEMDRRIAAMAAVHEQIYRSDQFDNIDAADYLGRIAQSLKESYGSAAELDLKLTSTIIDRDHAIPLALIANEVISNAFKYAFPSGEQGTIAIALSHRDSGMARLEVSDNGVGFTPSGETTGMGSRLISALAAQLKASYDYSGLGGARFHMDFPLAGAGEDSGI